MGLRARNGQWWYRVYIGGREVESRTTGLAAIASNRNKARKLHDERRRELLQQSAPRLTNLRFPEAAAQFIHWCELAEYRSKPNTARRIATSFVSIVYFFEGYKVPAVDAAAVESFKEWRATEHGVRDVTIRHDLHALSLFFKYARKHAWCAANPVDEVKKPSDAESIRIHVVTGEEERAYFKHARRNLYDLARLILLQGCRPEEILSLPQDGIDLKAQTLSIRGGKTRAARRTLDLCAESVRILARRLRKPGPWVFPSDRKPGRHLTKLNTSHDQACREAGVSFCLYDLRHSFATRLADAGVPVTTIAALLGHSGLRQVMRYVHPTAAAKKEAMRQYDALLRQPGIRKVAG